MRKLFGLIFLAPVGVLLASPASADVICGPSPDSWIMSAAVVNDNVVTSDFCLISGTVEGNVYVPADRFLFMTGGGSVTGNIEAEGGVALGSGTTVDGNVVQFGPGSVSFFGNGPGVQINGNLEMFGGRLFAYGTSTQNRVNGNIICDGGLPARPGAESDRRNWDGVGVATLPNGTIDTGAVDGRLGGNYECP